MLVTTNKYIVNLVILVIVVWSAPNAHAASGDIYNLGTLGGTSSQANGINAAGQVVGYSDTADGNRRAFLYSGSPSSGTMVDLGKLGGPETGTGSQAWAINASGQITGGSDQLVLINSSVYHAFLYTGIPGSGGAMADLGTVAGIKESNGFGINSAGQVVGESFPDPAGIPGPAHAFFYSGTPGSGGTITDLGQGSAFDINDSGQIIGDNNLNHAFLYVGAPGSGTMVDLGTLGGTISAARAINSNGQIAGGSFLSGSGPYHAFRYVGTPGSGGTMQDLGTLGGAGAFGLAINSAGDVVGFGSSSNGSQHAFAYVGTPGAGGQMYDLDQLLDIVNPVEGAKWTLFTATGINDSGLITGEGVYNDGPGGLSDGARAYILDASGLVSVPEPASGFILTLGGLTSAVVRHRRKIGTTNGGRQHGV